jgi:hypothetical protein
VAQPVPVAERRADFASRALAQLNLNFRGVLPLHPFAIMELRAPFERPFSVTALLYRRDAEIGACRARIRNGRPAEGGKRERTFQVVVAKFNIAAITFRAASRKERGNRERCFTPRLTLFLYAPFIGTGA